MGLTKSELFTAEQNQMAQWAKALAHPARMAILQHLLAANACINSDLVQELGLAQATVSQHLRELKDAGLIQGSIEGNAMNYCINPARWAEVAAAFRQLFDQYTGPRCC